MWKSNLLPACMFIVMMHRSNGAEEGSGSILILTRVIALSALPSPSRIWLPQILLTYAQSTLITVGLHVQSALKQSPIPKKI